MNYVTSILKFVQKNPTIVSAVASFIIEVLSSGKVDSALLFGIVAAIGAARTAHKKITTGSVLND